MSAENETMSAENEEDSSLQLWIFSYFLWFMLFCILCFYVVARTFNLEDMPSLNPFAPIQEKI